jgi:hypothetical protein
VAAGGSLAIVLQWAAACAGLDMPEPVALAFAGLMIFAVGYFTPTT